MVKMGNILMDKTGFSDKYITPSFWKRAASFIIDISIIQFIILWPCQAVFDKYVTFGIDSKIFMQTVPAELYLLLFILFVLAMLYFVFFDYYLDQTPGMMLFNLKVVSLNGDLTFWKCIVRNCFILPFFPFYIFWAVDPIHLAIYKNRFLERVTTTKTVYATTPTIYVLKKV